MLRRPPRSTRTDTLFPTPTLFLSLVAVEDGDGKPFARRYSAHGITLELRDAGRRFRKQGVSHEKTPYKAPLKVLMLVPLIKPIKREVCCILRTKAAVSDGESTECQRSEARRVGTECVSTCRHRVTPYL